MSEWISLSERQFLQQRANGRCEYCLIPDTYEPLSFEVDHIIAMKHGGTSVRTNLAWSCRNCNRRKGSDIASIDPLTKTLAALFNPRTQVWAQHFRLQPSGEFDGATLVGRTTIFLLQLNTPQRLEVRQALINIGLMQVV